MPVRLPVSTKILGGLAVVLSTGFLSMLIIYSGLSALKGAMHDLAEVKEPSSAATYEMEINAEGIGLGVLKYLDVADSATRGQVEDDQSDFERFHANYLRLVDTPEERALTDSVGAAYQELKTLGTVLMDAKDQQEALFTDLGENFERADRIIDDKLQTQVEDPSDRTGLVMAWQVRDLEADLAEVGFWLVNYQRAHRPEHKGFLFANEREFRESLASLNRLDLTEGERNTAAEVNRLFDSIMLSARQIISLDDSLRGRTTRLAALRAEIDRLLDERMQVLALAALREPRQAADRAAGDVLDTLRFLIPIFVLSAAIIGLLLTLSVTRPIQKLKRGTGAVSTGNLTYRIPPGGNDEFADLARNFNSMVERLQATTVSKDLLEASEEDLRETVTQLRREIGEREHAEMEQERLQESLRRSETLSAMGSLVAGVAHEVRKPLFGITSTLDAMEARFGVREEYTRYGQVLRGEVEQLNRLMEELLEYGRPPDQQLSPGSIREIIAEAVRTGEPLASWRHVAVVNRAADGLAPVRMNRARLLQVFQNLLENAVQHSIPGSTVMVDAEPMDNQAPGWIQCVVRDSGAGFAVEDLERVFEPFFSHRRGGTGLGLSIAQRIVEEHGGLISASNWPGGGGIITIRLPTTG